MDAARQLEWSSQREEANAAGRAGGGARGGRVGADESFEKRQMLWKGMTGRSWSEFVISSGVCRRLSHFSCKSR